MYMWVICYNLFNILIKCKYCNKYVFLMKTILSIYVSAYEQKEKRDKI